MISYAGVELLLPTAELCDFIERLISQCWTQEVTKPNKPPTDYASSSALLGVPGFAWSGITGWWTGVPGFWGSGELGLPSGLGGVFGLNAGQFWGSFGYVSASSDFPKFERPKPIKLQTLLWPRDAARWAIGHFLCTETQLNAIRDALPRKQNSKDLPLPATLVLSQEDQDGAEVARIEPGMYSLPPRPLSQLPGFEYPMDNLWLLTLVDERYFWPLWAKPNQTVPTNTTGGYWGLACGLWAARFLRLGAAGFKFMPPHTDYPDVNVTFVTGIGVMDSLAAGQGQRMVRKLDGTVTNETYDKSRAVYDANAGLVGAVKIGGEFALSEETEFITSPTDRSSNVDIDLAMPSNFQFLFPLEFALGQTNALQIGNWQVQNINVALGDVLKGHLGNGSTRYFAESYVLGRNPADGITILPAELVKGTKLARRVVRDWLKYEMSPSNYTFHGIVPWESEGISDLITWTYTHDEVSTKVERAPHDNSDRIHNLNHFSGKVPWSIQYGDYLKQIQIVTDICPVFGAGSGAPYLIGINVVKKTIALPAAWAGFGAGNSQLNPNGCTGINVACCPGPTPGTFTTLPRQLTVTILGVRNQGQSTQFFVGQKSNISWDGVSSWFGSLEWASGFPTTVSGALGFSVACVGGVWKATFSGCLVGDVALVVAACGGAAGVALYLETDWFTVPAACIGSNAPPNLQLKLGVTLL